ncbi:MAG: nucleotidyltransferase domain-containing protein [Nitrososphaeria archaeon]
MLKSPQEKTLERMRDLKMELGGIVEQLKNLGALKIVLFGSYVTGEVWSGSDLDILVVMPPSKTGKEWMSEIYSKVERNIASDILAFTEKELEKGVKISRFLRYVLRTGMVIYESKPKN